MRIINQPTNQQCYDLLWSNNDGWWANSNWKEKTKDQFSILLGKKYRDIDLIDKNVMDIGSGPGKMSIAMMEKGCKRLIMIDGSSIGLEKAENQIRKLTTNKNFEIQTYQVDLENFKYDLLPSDNDLITMSDTLQHLNGYTVINDIVNLLRVGGLFAFNFFKTGTTPNHFIRLREETKNLSFEEKIKYCEENNISCNGGLYENITTDYLNNYSHGEIKQFLIKNLSIKIINSEADRFLIQRIS